MAAGPAARCPPGRRRPWPLEAPARLAERLARGEAEGRHGRDREDQGDVPFIALQSTVAHGELPAVLRHVPLGQALEGGRIAHPHGVALYDQVEARVERVGAGREDTVRIVR